MAKQYLDFIDLSKGVGIILVIIGHGIMSNIGIDVFHMPLFFFLAGLTFTPPHTSVSTFIIKKTNRIFVPYVFFTILSFCVELCIGSLNPQMPFNGPLWFLGTIFTVLMLYALIHLVFGKNVLAISSISVIFLIFAVYIAKYTTLAWEIPFSLNRAMAAIIFIHLGWCYKEYSNIFKTFKMQSWILLPVSIALYVVGLFITCRYYDTHGMTFINTEIYSYNLALFIVTSIGGLMTVVSSAQIIKRLPIVNWLGKNSLVILCIHFPIMERLNYFCFYCFTELQVTYMPYKLALVIASYIVTLCVSCFAILLCRKYLPKLTGYKNLIPKTNL